MLQVIQVTNRNGHNVGFKAAGGIGTLAQAASYLFWQTK